MLSSVSPVEFRLRYAKEVLRRRTAQIIMITSVEPQQVSDKLKHWSVEFPPLRARKKRTAPFGENGFFDKLKSTKR